ncbi:MAG TPA: hypothetical protein PKD53_22610 [Chloroflexaceae bacterium]|nr:hypothetical protein [Chloroflexaceae bacterium]
MTTTPYNDRWEQSARAVEAARAAFAAWVRGRNDEDKRRFHASQLADIGAVLESAAGALRDSLGRSLASEDGAGLYRLCREHDAALGMAYLLWERVRGPFDQRDSQAAPARTNLLRAADEVAWSCYKPVLNRADALSGRVKQWPPPLACLDPTYLPLVSQRRRGDLAAAIDAARTPTALLTLLAELPVTLIRLPPWTVEAPWSLVFVAHEVGHQIYQQLGAGVSKTLSDGLLAVGAGAGGAAGQGWGEWREECFADLFSLLTMGQWALWALVDVERGTPAQMTTSESDAYPPAVVRLALMAESLRRLGVDPTPALRGLDLAAIAAEDPVARARLELVPGAVDVLMGNLGGRLGTLAELCEAGDPGGPASAEEGPRSAGLAAALAQGRVPRLQQKGHQTTRQLARAAARAWSELAPDLAALDGPARSARRKALGDAIVTSLNDHAPDGTRGASDPRAMASLGRRMVESLLAAPPPPAPAQLQQ